MQEEGEEGGSRVVLPCIPCVLDGCVFVECSCSSRVERALSVTHEGALYDWLWDALLRAVRRNFVDCTRALYESCRRARIDMDGVVREAILSESEDVLAFLLSDERTAALWRFEAEMTVALLAPRAVGSAIEAILLERFPAGDAT